MRTAYKVEVWHDTDGCDWSQSVWMTRAEADVYAKARIDAGRDANIYRVRILDGSRGVLLRVVSDRAMRGGKHEHSGHV